MPYIDAAARDAMFTLTPRNPGELNYELTSIINGYLLQHGMKYQTINDIIGALEGCKLEFYRRIAAPYEDTKITENGDVY